MRINMEVSDEMNNARKGLGVSWRDVLKAGIAALSQAKAPDGLGMEALRSDIRLHLLAANKEIKTIDDILKALKVVPPSV